MPEILDFVNGWSWLGVGGENLALYKIRAGWKTPCLLKHLAVAPTLRGK